MDEYEKHRGREPSEGLKGKESHDEKRTYDKMEAKLIHSSPRMISSLRMMEGGRRRTASCCWTLVLFNQTNHSSTQTSNIGSSRFKRVY